MKHFRNNFTLLEILVAVAVLVIMMSFLFQFVVSAQRVWAAASARTYLADQAHAVFQLMGEDFGQIVTVIEEDDPDSVAGWHCTPNPKATNPGNLTRLCFFVEDRDDADGALYGVMYYYDSTAQKLYRIRTTNPAWQQLGKTQTPDSYDDFGLPGATPADVATATGTNDDDYVVAENVTAFTVQSAGDTNKTALPRFLRITMTVKVPENLANTTKGGQVLDRTFSRVYFFNDGR